MSEILNNIVAHTKRRVEERKREIPLDQLKAQVLGKRDTSQTFPFEEALQKNKPAFICEVKRASPSKGMLVEDFPYLEIADAYEKGGAAAVSVLTEPDWFRGSDQYLQEIAERIKIPVLRKDFTIDPYQIYEAKMLGADAVLLICAILSFSQLEEYIGIAHEIGISAMVETHTEADIKNAIAAGARVIGVNNRNLLTMEVDINHSIQLRSRVPAEILFISESGIRTAKDVHRLMACEVNGILIGECLMKATDKAEMIREFKKGAQGK